jgi:hypothetical protein
MNKVTWIFDAGLGGVVRVLEYAFCGCLYFESKLCFRKHAFVEKCEHEIFRF